MSDIIIVCTGIFFIFIILIISCWKGTSDKIDNKQKVKMLEAFRAYYLPTDDIYSDHLALSLESNDRCSTSKEVKTKKSPYPPPKTKYYKVGHIPKKVKKPKEEKWVDIYGREVKRSKFHCNYCHTKIDRDATFCHWCGTKLVEVKSN